MGYDSGHETYVGVQLYTNDLLKLKKVKVGKKVLAWKDAIDLSWKMGDIGEEVGLEASGNFYGPDKINWYVVGVSVSEYPDAKEISVAKKKVEAKLATINKIFGTKFTKKSVDRISLLWISV